MFVPRQVIGRPLPKSESGLTSPDLPKARTRGVFIANLEAGAGWISYWLDRMDAAYSSYAGCKVPLKEKPSFYFNRNVWISADPDERTIWAMAQIVGDEKFFWATDYPHPDHPGNYLEELQGMIKGMTPAARRGVLGENVAKAYKLGQ